MPTLGQMAVCYTRIVTESRRGSKVPFGDADSGQSYDRGLRLLARMIARRLLEQELTNDKQWTEGLHGDHDADEDADEGEGVI